MFTINAKSAIPIFEQIIEQVGKYVAVGILKPLDQLPTVRNLAKELGINPNTVAKAYKACEEMNLIYSEVGKGYFVRESSQGVNNVVETGYKDLKKSAKYLVSIGETKDTILKFLEGELS